MANPPSASPDLDLFEDSILGDPHPTYAELRSLGEVVYLPRHEIWAVPRYSSVRKVLENWEKFSSADGVGLVDEYNQFFAGTMLASDPPEHDVLRGILASRVSPRAIRSLREDVAIRAQELVDEVIARKEFDAVDDLAKAFPVSVVADLVGLPPEGREHLLDWADATFNVLGPSNERAQSSLPAFDEVFGYISTMATPERLAPGSMGMTVYEAAERGEIREDQVLPLMLAYLLPAMDTTVNAIASAVWLFSDHQDQWDEVVAEPDRVRVAFEEVMRLETPVLAFSRVAKGETEVGEMTIPDGGRVLVMFASANRDAEKWEDPERFDIKREPGDHLGFGYGVHGCPGQGLARLEAQSIISAFARRSVRFEQTGEAERHLNNVVRGFAHVPVRVAPV